MCSESIAICCQAHDVQQNVIIFGSLVNVYKEVCPNGLQSLLVLAHVGSIVAPGVHVVLLTSGHCYFQN